MKLKLLVTSCRLLLCLIAYAGQNHTEICFGAGCPRLCPVPKSEVGPLQPFSIPAERIESEGLSIIRTHIISLINFMPGPSTNMQYL